MSAPSPSSRPKRPAWFPHLMALATIVMWSFSFLFIVQANTELTPIGVVVLRKDIFALMVIGLLIWRRPKVRHLTAKQWAVIVGLAIVGGPLYHLAFSWSAGTASDGEPRIDPGLLGLILATVPVHAGWLGWIFLRERLRPVAILALGLGLCGVAIVLFGRYGRIDLLPVGRLEGPIGATVSAIIGAGIAVLTRAGGRILDPPDLVAVSGGIYVLMIATLHPFAELDRVAELSTAGWVAILFLGIFGSGFAFLTWAAALRDLPAVTVATYLFLASVLAAFWGWIFRGVPIGFEFFAGAALVLTGLLLMARPTRPRATDRAVEAPPALPDEAPA